MAIRGREGEATQAVLPAAASPTYDPGSGSDRAQLYARSGGFSMSEYSEYFLAPKFVVVATHGSTVQNVFGPFGTCLFAPTL